MRKEKQLLLDEIKGKIEDSGSFVLTRYEGLGANAVNELREGLAKTGSELEVVRKRILIKAALEAGIELDLKLLEGHIGVVFTGEEAIEAAKTLVNFGKETKGAVQVIGGRFEGKLCDAAQVETLSRLPGKDEMRSQFLGLMEAPMSQTLAVMEALLCSPIHCLENKSKADSSES